MERQEQVPLKELEPLLLRAELLLERAVAQQQRSQEQREREHTWIELELSRCVLPVQQLSTELGALMEQMGIQRQDTQLQRWQAELQHALRQIEAVTLHLEELQATIASDAMPSLEPPPMVATPSRQLQELLTRRQRQMAVLQAELLELRSQLGMAAEATANGNHEDTTDIPSLFEDQP